MPAGNVMESNSTIQDSNDLPDIWLLSARHELQPAAGGKN